MDQECGEGGAVGQNNPPSPTLTSSLAQQEQEERGIVGRPFQNAKVHRRCRDVLGAVRRQCTGWQQTVEAGEVGAKLLNTILDLAAMSQHTSCLRGSRIAFGQSVLETLSQVAPWGGGVGG